MLSSLLKSSDFVVTVFIYDNFLQMLTQSRDIINPTTIAIHRAPTRPIVFDENLSSGALVNDLL